jgi:hypothetical protein
MRPETRRRNASVVGSRPRKRPRWWSPTCVCWLRRSSPSRTSDKNSAWTTAQLRRKLRRSVECDADRRQPSSASRHVARVHARSHTSAHVGNRRVAAAAFETDGAQSRQLQTSSTNVQNYRTRLLPRPRVSKSSHACVKPGIRAAQHLEASPTCAGMPPTEYSSGIGRDGVVRRMDTIMIPNSAQVAT